MSGARLTIERGSAAYQLVQHINTGTPLPDHEGVLLFVVQLLKPIYSPDGYMPRRV